MGRPRKPESEKLQAGNPGKRAVLPDPELEVIRDATPPEGMSENQRKYWNRYAPYMIKNNRLTELNVSDLENLCYFEDQRDNIHKILLTNSPSLLQEKKNYHGDVVDLIEGVYSKLSRNYTAMIRVLKADLRLRTDKVTFRVKPEKKSKFEGMIGGKKDRY